MTLGLAAQPTLEQLERSKTSVASESALFHGYSRAEHRTTTVRCACGDLIVAISLSDADVLLAVGAHNRTTPHRAWRENEDAA